MITLNHNIIFSKIDSPLDVPHASESESSDDHDLMTDHTTLFSTAIRISLIPLLVVPVMGFQDLVMLIVIHCFMVIKQEWVVEQETASYCFSHAGLSDDQKLDIILNFAQYNPVATYQFPSKVEYGKNCSFQHHYLQSFPWLGYSAKLDGCLCLPCCLFSLPGNSSQILFRKLIRIGLS